MAENHIVEIRNIPAGFERKVCLSLFSQFGTTKKLYIDPTGSYGKVYYDTADQANAALELDGQPPHNLNVTRPERNTTAPRKARDSTARPTRNSLLDRNTNENANDCSQFFSRNGLASPPASTMNSSYYRNYDSALDVTISNDYVDVFGRVVQTLEGEDGDVYISLNELKKSGFELFEAGLLPRRGRHYDDLLLEQFELYMKMKAAKFMSRHKLTISDENIGRIIGAEKDEYFSKRVVQRGSGNTITITTATSNAPKARTSFGPHGRSDTPDTNRSFGSEDAKPHFNQQRQRNRSLNRGDSDHRDGDNFNNAPRRSDNFNRGDNERRESGNYNNDRRRSDNFNRGDNTRNNNFNRGDNARRDNFNRSDNTRRDSNNFNSDRRRNDNFNRNDGDNSANTPQLRRPYSQGTQNRGNSSDSFNRADSAKGDDFKKPYAKEGSSNSNEQPLPMTRVSLTMNTPQKVTVVHVESESTAWVQLASNVNVIGDILSQTIEESKTAKIIKPVLNHLCAALFCNIWFRAIILSTHPLKVQYVDYGNENTETLTEVRELSNKLAGIPSQAVRISFEFGSNMKLEPHMEFFIYPVFQEEDGTYVVRSDKSQLPKSVLKQSTPPKPKPVENESPAVQPIEEEKPQKPASPPTAQPAAPVIPETKPAPTPTLSEVSKPQRKNVVDDPWEIGIIEFGDKVNETTFVAFVMPQAAGAQIETLEQITDDCKPDASFKPKLGELVAVSKDDCYVRGTVINNLNGRYTCALIDYGLVISVNEVGVLPDKYKDIPEFACQCSATPDVVKLVESSTDIVLQTNSPPTAVLIIDGKEYSIKTSKWDPFKTSPLAIQKPVVKEQAVFNKRPSSKALKAGDIVMIVAEHQGSLLVRTKECNSLLREVNQELVTYKGEALAKPPKVGQLVVAPFDDDKLYRGIIDRIENGKVVVEYIDYGNYSTVEAKKLLAINEKLATMLSTLIEISLKGFVGQKFSEKAVNALAVCNQKKEKFTVATADGGNAFELTSADKTNLSEKLLALDRPPAAATPKTNEAPAPAPKPAPAPQKSSAINYNDMPFTKLEPGVTNVMCMYTGGIKEGTIAVCTLDSADKVLSDLGPKIMEYVEKDNQAYRPQEAGDMCLALFEGEWFRAMLLSEENDLCWMFYVDYGNMSSVNAKDLRKMPAELAEIPCIGIMCTLDGVLKGKDNVEEPLLTRLKTEIQENEFYDIDVIKKHGNEDDDGYLITIPSLYEKLKKDRLL